MASDPNVFAVLFHNANFSLKGFARAVNVKGQAMFGIRLSYTHTHVGRWLLGALPRHPEPVAAVLSDAWGVQITPVAIWRSLAAGRPLEPSPQTTPWVVMLTTDELSRLMGTEMIFDRRELLTMYSVLTGATLVEPLAAWLAIPAPPLPADPEQRPGQINESAVEALEQSAAVLVRCNLQYGGQVVRHAAVDELRRGIRLIQDARYTQSTARRLLAAASYLANITGLMCLDSGLPGLAQRYLLLGLKLAREAGDHLLGANILLNLAEQLRDEGCPSDGVKLANAALRLAEDADAPAGFLARLESLRATMTADLNRPAATRRGVGTSLDLLADEGSDGRPMPYWAVLSNEPEIHSIAGSAFRRLIKHDPRYTAEAAQHTRAALAVRGRDAQLARSALFDTVGLARIHLALDEPDQATERALAALDALPQIRSTRARRRLAGLLPATEPYRGHEGIRVVRQRLLQVAAIGDVADGS